MGRTGGLDTGEMMRRQNLVKLLQPLQQLSVNGMEPKVQNTGQHTPLVHFLFQQSSAALYRPPEGSASVPGPLGNANPEFTLFSLRLFIT